MKKKLIVIASISILVLLSVRLLFIRHDKRKKEKIAYVHDLHYKFSASVDSIVSLNSIGFGLLAVHILDGSVDPSVEKGLNKKLTYNADLRFLLLNKNGRLLIFSQSVDPFNTGDSIFVNTDNDQFLVYRGNKMISEIKVSDALSGRPF